MLYQKGEGNGGMGSLAEMVDCHYHERDKTPSQG